MTAISRRTFFEQSAKSVAVAGFLSGAVRELPANPLGIPIGSQTYPHRQRIKDGDLAGLCKDMAALGIGSLELCSPGYGEFAGLADGKEARKVIEDHGLKCPSAHFEMSELRTKQPQMIAWAKDIGMAQMGTASLGGPAQGGVTTMDAVKKAADEYNKIGEAAAKAGIQQFLHDEGFELSKVDGRLTYEVLLELLDPKLVKMQFQMSAMRTVGDPVMYFTKYPGRFLSMHLQGVDLNPPPPPPPPPPGEQGARGGRGRGGRGGPQLAVGKDSLDWAKIFAAAKTGGVKNYFVEQNWDLTVQSVAYLKTLNV
ncbi:putative Sugar phosphate isomerase/epimerase [Candidatus Sulfopaludibacter sp. SbA4]|nr:putative Sugar phosphate isomerase/epimerase [Candidatus Sulfopaludibacter sp. SbA4]